MKSESMDYSQLEKYASKTRYILYVVCQTTVRALALVVPFLTEFLIDSVSSKDVGLFLNYSIQLLAVNVMYVVLFSLTFYIRVCYEDASIALKKKEIVNKMFQMPLSAVQEKGSGYFVQRFSSTVENCRSFLIDKPVNFYINILYGIGIILSMLRINIRYAFFLLIVFPLLAYIYRFLANKIHSVTAEREHLSDKGNSLVEEAYSCNYTIRTNNSEKWMQSRILSILIPAFRKDREFNKIETVYDFFLITGLMNIVTVLVYILGGYYVFQNTITFGMVVSMSLLFSKLWIPLEFYLDFPKERAKYLAHKKRLDELLSYEEAAEIPPRELESFKKLRIENLTYSIGPKPLFENLSLELNSGEHVAIYGSNGSGKSTLANFIAAINTDYTGHIFYNGIDYRTLHPHSVREHICLIPAKAELFTGTIKENLLLGQSTEIPEAVSELLSKKGLSLDFVLQENGSNLSSGESKLLQLARGFCRNSDLYIIDEPLNFIDQNYSEMIVSVLDTLFDKKTVIIISHDQRVFHSCTTFYHLDNHLLTKTDDVNVQK